MPSSSLVYVSLNTKSWIQSSNPQKVLSIFLFIKQPNLLKLEKAKTVGTIKEETYNVFISSLF